MATIEDQYSKRAVRNQDSILACTASVSSKQALSRSADRMRDCRKHTWYRFHCDFCDGVGHWQLRRAHSACRIAKSVTHKVGGKPGNRSARSCIRTASRDTLHLVAIIYGVCSLMFRRVDDEFEWVGVWCFSISLRSTRGGLNERRVFLIRYYPCQTCLPQAHCTVSVGTLLVNCCLQTGQGLVITYVITLFSSRQGRLSKTMHVAYQKSCFFADRTA